MSQTSLKPHFGSSATHFCTTQSAVDLFHYIVVGIAIHGYILAIHPSLIVAVHIPCLFESCKSRASLLWDKPQSAPHRERDSHEYKQDVKISVKNISKTKK